MSMFVTFYSFKGGVGRTLALANVATLLASDRNDPCRVLVWDFDMAAPGLQDVMDCKWRDAKLGFIDYVHSYLRNANVDNIKDYIYRTAVPGVDILPAGFMGPKYAQKLDDIQWQEIYDEARGFQFIANTKAQISQLAPSYDYILIDSLTGYSDVGGICVNQLADAVALIFRLNKQNIEGTSKVYRTIRKYAEDRALQSQPEKVIPVISPAWPFAAPETNEWYQKAKEVFGNQRIFTLSFEGSMMLGEKVLCAIDEKYPIEPPILRDYRGLTQHLRSLNPQDRQTAFKLAKRLQEQDQFLTAIDLFGNLAERYPDVERYWRELTTTVQMVPTGAHKKILPRVNEIIRHGCELKKPWAYVAKAWLAETVDNNPKMAIEDFGHAIELDPGNPELYLSRGFSRVNHEEHAAAVQDLLAAIKSGLRGPRLAFAYSQLATSYNSLRQPEKALVYFSKAIKQQPNDAPSIFFRALTLYGLGRYDDAIADLTKAAKIDPFRDRIKILNAHIAAAQGKRDEALRILNAIRPQLEVRPSELLVLAEAYLVVEPTEALNLLEANADVINEWATVAAFMKAFASVLLDMDKTLAPNLALLRKSGSSPPKENWDVTELREFLRWGKAQGKMTESQRMQLSELLSDAGWSTIAVVEENPIIH